MKKVFIEPKLAIVEINSADIIATSDTGTGGSTNPSPWGARGRDDDEDFDF